MPQKKYHYQITHLDELEIDTLEKHSLIKEVTSRTVDLGRERRSRVTIEATEDGNFSEIDNFLEREYENVWFDY